MSKVAPSAAAVVARSTAAISRTTPTQIAAYALPDFSMLARRGSMTGIAQNTAAMPSVMSGSRKSPTVLGA